VAIVTGANTGLGFETAAALAAKGAHVVLAVRNLDKGRAAAERIATRFPGAKTSLKTRTSRRSSPCARLAINSTPSTRTSTCSSTTPAS